MYSELMSELTADQQKLITSLGVTRRIFNSMADEYKKIASSSSSHAKQQKEVLDITAETSKVLAGIAKQQGDISDIEQTLSKIEAQKLKNTNKFFGANADIGKMLNHQLDVEKEKLLIGSARLKQEQKIAGGSMSPHRR